MLSEVSCSAVVRGDRRATSQGHRSAMLCTQRSVTRLGARQSTHLGATPQVVRFHLTQRVVLLFFSVVFVTNTPPNKTDTKRWSAQTASARRARQCRTTRRPSEGQFCCTKTGRRLRSRRPARQREPDCTFRSCIDPPLSHCTQLTAGTGRCLTVARRSPCASEVQRPRHRQLSTWATARMPVSGRRPSQAHTPSQS